MNPSKKYPYGMEKIKNFVVLIPAFMFIYCGGATLYSGLSEMYYQNFTIEPDHSSMSSIVIYFLSLGVESFVIFKNILDSQSLQSEGGQPATFKQKLANIFLKKDPLLMAILYENIITLTSTSIPILSSIVGMLFPSPYIPIVGQSFIALI